MRVALLGGSFDPVHVGHLFIAEVAVVELGYDRVIFMPASRSPHKRSAQYASGHHRVRMLEAAVGGRSEFSICEWEIEKGGVSYTIDTVQYIRRTVAFDGRLGLIIGDDLVEGLETWKSVEELLSVVDLVVMNRVQGSPRSVDRPHTAVDNVRLPVSASQIRERARIGSAYRYLVPEAVYHYIEGHGLYENAD